MNLTVLKDALYAWASAHAGVTTIWDEPNAPRPALPYVRMKLIGPRKTSGLDEIRNEGDGVFTLTGPRQFTLSVNLYGPGVDQITSDLITSLEIPDVTADFIAAKLSVVRVEGPRDLTRLIQTDFEQRLQFDVTLGATEELAVDPGTIETVTATSELGDGTEVITVTTEG